MRPGTGYLQIGPSSGLSRSMLRSHRIFAESIRPTRINTGVFSEMPAALTKAAADLQSSPWTDADGCR